jgi:hypothetical protein
MGSIRACGEGRQITCQCRHQKQDRGSAEQTQRISWAEAEEHSGERAAHKKGDRQAEAQTPCMLATFCSRLRVV